MSEALAGLLEEAHETMMLLSKTTQQLNSAEADAKRLYDALDYLDTELADVIEFRYEGKEMATSFYEQLRLVSREALRQHREQGE